jgi:putative hemolysin
MVTLEDILEELVGEIHDEYDRLPSYVTKSGNSWVVGGFATLSHIREACGIELPVPDNGVPLTTVNEWVLQRLGKPVQGGEILSADGVRIIVRKVRRQRVLEAQIASDRGTSASMDADVAT